MIKIESFDIGSLHRFMAVQGGTEWFVGGG
jgi:hypothetical protein